MKNELEIRKILINNTIRLIAEGGFEKATTHAITFSGPLTPDVNMNEVYIYRLFGGKENLYEAAFNYLDKEILFALHNCIDPFADLERSTRKKLYDIYIRVWRFVLNNELYFRCYIRYYYSIYFKDTSLKTHTKLFESIVLEFSPLFEKGVDAKLIMHSVYIAMLDFAVRVYNGDLQDTPTNVEHIFNILYSMMMAYFKDTRKQSK